MLCCHPTSFGLCASALLRPPQQLLLDISHPWQPHTDLFTSGPPPACPASVWSAVHPPCHAQTVRRSQQCPMTAREDVPRPCYCLVGTRLGFPLLDASRCCLLLMPTCTCQVPLLLLFLLLSLAMPNHVSAPIVYLHRTMPAPTVGAIPDRLLQFLHAPVFPSCSFPPACLPCSRHTAAAQILHSQIMVARLGSLIHCLTD
jgi:hypothetical protein